MIQLSLVSDFGQTIQDACGLKSFCQCFDTFASSELLESFAAASWLQITSTKKTTNSWSNLSSLQGTRILGEYSFMS